MMNLSFDTRLERVQYRGGRMPALGRSPQELFAPSSQLDVPRLAGPTSHAGSAPVGAGHKVRLLQLVVGSLDCARVDGQPNGHRPHRRQFLTGVQGPAQDELADLVDNLLADRDPTREG
jgi:hypothetical protein